jgi:hypothetical protein
MAARALIEVCRGAAVMLSLWLSTAPLFGQAKDPRATARAVVKPQVDQVCKRSSRRRQAEGSPHRH